ncbi:MAG: DUF2520 domain-containing protein [Alistipes sp.]|nr:DUF2520 domain-containing protein [Alistipes sp.]
MKRFERIAIVGSGNLAEALAHAVAGCGGVTLAAVAARNAARGREIAEACGAPYVGTPDTMPDADLCILAVSDSAIATVAESLPRTHGMTVAHTSGATPMESIPDHFDGRGVFYPLQTFTAGRAVDFGVIPLFVEGSDEPTTLALEELAGRLSRRVARADSEQRRALHLAGVFACNFANHMFQLGAQTVERAGFGFDVLRPLIAETAAKAVESQRPADVQTGPARRGDRGSQERHLALLAGDGASSEIYKLISDNIWETSRKI